MNLLSLETISFPPRTKKMFFFYPNQKDKVLRRTKRRLLSQKVTSFFFFFFLAWIKENDPHWTECKKYCLNQAARGAASWGSGPPPASAGVVLVTLAEEYKQKGVP